MPPRPATNAKQKTDSAACLLCGARGRHVYGKSRRGFGYHACAQIVEQPAADEALLLWLQRMVSGLPIGDQVPVNRAAGSLNETTDSSLRWTPETARSDKWWVASIMAGEAEGVSPDGTTS